MRDFEELSKLVFKWGKERKLYHKKHGATIESQYLKYLSEIGELSDALLKEDTEGVKDAIGDSIICLLAKLKLERNHKYINSFQHALNNDVLEDIYITIHPAKKTPKYFIIKSIESSNKNTFDSILYLMMLEHHLVFKKNECLDSAYNEIKDRKGVMKNRTFVKDE